jgi:osmotically-inducible protein OsmY
VNGGEVELSGIMSDLRSKQAALETAGNTTGVWRVIDQLNVVPEVIPSDVELQELIRRKLSSHAYTADEEITATAEQGVVTLYGRVPSWSVKEEAGKIVTLIRGVVQVKNQIQVAYAWPFIEDDEIQAEIEEELRWSPFVDADCIQVSVEDGIATLAGEVLTWRARLAAAENAYEGGAHTVVNNVKVEYGPDYYLTR